MQRISEGPQPSRECPLTDDVWIQITFTIDPEYFRQLWAYAEDRNSSVSSVVRENIVDFLTGLPPVPQKRTLLVKENGVDRS